MCILTTKAFSFPMGRPLPNCKNVVIVDAVLEARDAIYLDRAQVNTAIAYTLKLFSLPRRQQLQQHALPYLVLPMSSAWTMSDACGRPRGLDLAWGEIEAGVSSDKRMAGRFESSGALAKEAVYVIGRQYHEVFAIRQDIQAQVSHFHS